MSCRVGLGQRVVAQGGDSRSRASRWSAVVLGGCGRRLEQHGALGQLAAEVVLAGVDLAVHLVAPGGEDVAPRLDRVLPAAGRLDRELALPADAVDVGVDRVHRRLEPAPAAWRLVADDGAHDLVAVAEDVGGDLDRVADAALGRVTSAVDGRAGWLISVLAGASLRFGAGISRGSIQLEARLTTSHVLPQVQRRPTAPHLAPRRAARARGLQVRRLARGRRPVVVADAAARAAGPARVAVQVGVGVRGVAGAAGRAARAGDPIGRTRLPRAQRVLDR